MTVYTISISACSIIIIFKLMDLLNRIMKSADFPTVKALKSPQIVNIILVSIHTVCTGI